MKELLKVWVEQLRAAEAHADDELARAEKIGVQASEMLYMARNKELNIRRARQAIEDLLEDETANHEVPL